MGAKEVLSRRHLPVCWDGAKGCGALGRGVEGCWVGGMKEAEPRPLGTPGLGEVGGELEEA